MRLGLGLSLVLPLSVALADGGTPIACGWQGVLCLGYGGVAALVSLIWAGLFLALLRPALRPRVYAQVRVVLYARFGWPPPQAAQESRALDDLAASLADLLMMVFGVCLPSWAALIGVALVALA